MGEGGFGVFVYVFVARAQRHGLNAHDTRTVERGHEVHSLTRLLRVSMDGWGEREEHRANKRPCGYGLL